MPIYEKPTKALMTQWANEHLSSGKTFGRGEPVKWFAEHYPKLKSTTIRMHVDGMSVNVINRRHHPSIRPGRGYDLFYKLGPDSYRLWDPQNDPQPLYKENIEALGVAPSNNISSEDEESVQDGNEGGSEFAFEKDLQNYLVKNLHSIEPGLRLYEEEGLTGVQFSVGGRFIDILAVDRDNRFVVIELKVSRGYDRVIGQLLRYMGWVEQNLESAKSARGIIVAKEITDDLELACSRLMDVKLIEYELSFTLRHVEVPKR
jgi:endonuclease